MDYPSIYRRHYEVLTNNLECPYGLLLTLYSQEILNEKENANIRSSAGWVQQNELLLNAMIDKFPVHQLKFLEALNDTKQSHLAAFINNDGNGEALFLKR